MASSSSFSSPSRTMQWKYDMFISFRGEDTRKNFSDHLYDAFLRRGIIAFRDENSLERAKSIAPELLKAIQNSRFSVVLLSPNYASSSWCLDELIHILKCMNNTDQGVFPVFYGVDPSDVRKQSGNFGKAFAELEEKFGNNCKKVKRWRIALMKVANLSGWHLQDRHESKLIQDIVEEIFIRLNNIFSSCTIKDLVGIGTHLEKLKLLLDLSSHDDVRIIGIHGMGGIGKTAIARFIFETFSYQFEASSFLANVREVSGNGQGLLLLQEQLLNEILKENNVKIWDTFKGVNIIRNRLGRKKVLVVLDDVDKSNQLEALLPGCDRFGLGTRIIITTRDVHLLARFQVNKIYKMETLNFNDALHLFNLKAFRSVYSKENYLELSKKFVSYAGGLPLALEVLGGMLYGRSVDEWISALERLKDDSEKEILEKLEISLDGLKPTEKKIFLDIACFFKGMDRNYVMKILDRCGFHATIGINVLIEKSLITIGDENKIWMHDLLQEMGQNTVKKESLDEPGKRSRLWDAKDVYHMFSKNTGTEAIEAISCKSFEQKVVHLNANAFMKMNKLRLLKISNVELSQGLQFLSNELQLFEWHGYPLKQFPLSFKPEKIVEIDLRWSSIKQLWNETIIFDRLRFINLSHSVNLQGTPNFTGTPNLEELILEGCINLLAVHPSIGLLKMLNILNMKDCRSLQSLTSRMEMESLHVLNLSGCSKIKEFPDITGNMGHLSEIFLDGTSIKQLPLSIKHLTGLVLLNLNGCKELISLPDSICDLKSLKAITLYGCTKLAKLPDNIGNLESLEVLDMGGTAIRQPPSSIALLKNLKTLSFLGCGGKPSQPWSSLFAHLLFPRKRSNDLCLSLPPLSGLNSLTRLNLSYCNLQEGAIPLDIGSLSSLKELDMSGNEFFTIPSSISELINLQRLDLVSCRKLQRLPLLPANIKSVNADDCVELEDFPNPPEQGISVYSILSLRNCHKLIEDQDCSILPIMTWLKSYILTKSWLESYVEGLPRSGTKLDILLPGNRIPDWMTHQKDGCSVSIDLSRNWFDDDTFKGFATCAVLRPNQRPVSVQVSGTRYTCCELTYPFSTYGKMHVCSQVLRAIQVGSDHLWMLYLPRHSLRYTTFGFKQDHIIFWFGPGNRSSRCNLEIIRCAARPVYEQDIISLQDILRPVNEKRNDCVGFESHHPKSRSLDEELHPKRMRRF